MARDVSSDLQALLDLPSCETQTTLDLYLTDTSEFHFATTALADVDIGGDTVDYTADLRTADVIKQSVTTATDRVSVQIQNVDKSFGGTAAAEDLTHAAAVVGRYYSDPHGVETPVWVELFRGEAFPTSIDESKVTLEIINDLAACGFCVADWTLAENCQFIFKDSGTCGYSGGETLCNKKRRSPAGCQGRANDHHFGGMEFPEFQTASIGIDSGDSGDGTHHNCPRVDMWIAVKGDGESIAIKRAGDITTDDFTYNPITRLFEPVKRAEIIYDEPLWYIRSGLASGFSSFTHPVLPYREHLNGLRVRDTWEGDPLLLWRLAENELVDVKIERSFSVETTGDVMHIETEGGHIYAYGSSRAMIVCHNYKDPEDL